MAKRREKKCGELLCPMSQDVLVRVEVRYGGGVYKYVWLCADHATEKIRAFQEAVSNKKDSEK